MKFTTDDHARIARAIAAAESRTSGEIFCVLAGQVSSYRDISLGWAAASALILPLALVPLGLLFLVPVGSIGYFACVAVAGALVNGGLPLMIVAAQDLAPNAMGAASGLMMGFTWGMAGVLYIGIGALQEVLGVQTAMALSFLTLIPGAILAYAVLQRNRAAIDAAN